MALNNPKPGPSDASTFVLSALPWVTSSVAAATVQRWDFPKVTKFVQIRNTNTTATNGLYVGFTSEGVAGTNRFLIPGNESETFDVRCRSVFILQQAGTPAYSILAGLTTVDVREFPVLTGSAVDPTNPLPGENWIGVG